MFRQKRVYIRTKEQIRQNKIILITHLICRLIWSLWRFWPTADVGLPFARALGIPNSGVPLLHHLPIIHPLGNSGGFICQLLELTFYLHMANMVNRNILYKWQTAELDAFLDRACAIFSFISAAAIDMCPSYWISLRYKPMW